MEFLIFPGFLLAAFLLYDFSRKPQTAVFIILLGSIIDAWFIQPLNVKIGLNIYIHDVVFVLIFASALFRIFFLQQFRYVSPLLLIYGIIIFLGLYTGLQTYGTSAGVDFRYFFYYWVGALYFMSFHYSKQFLEKVQKNWFWLCLILLGIVYFRFVADLLHLPIAQTWIKADATNVRFRVLSSQQAYLLGVVVVMLFIRYLTPDKDKPSKIITVMFIVAVVVLQHRSVWAATFFAIVSSILLPSIKTTKFISNLLVIGVIGFILLAPLLYFGYADIFIKTISRSASNATHLTTGTFGARMVGWQHIMDYWQNLPATNQFFGDPFGGSYAGMKVAPHNFFLQSLLRAGTFGTVIITLLYLLILAKLYLNIKQHPEDGLYFGLFFMLIMGQLAYYIPYGQQSEHGIILGIAASLAKRGMTGEDKLKKQAAANSQYFLNYPVIKAKADVSSA